jgi:hypothetical protein
VLKELQKGTIGLVRFPSVEPALRNFKLDLDHTERIVMWNGKNADAPDLAAAAPLNYLSVSRLDHSGQRLLINSCIA